MTDDDSPAASIASAPDAANAGAELDGIEFCESDHPAIYYQDMLADHTRMARYRAGIESVVHEGDVVADLGTGLGVLAVMALQAGAARVYAVDARPRALALAERLIRANGGADRIRLIQGDAAKVDLPEPVDVIVNELIGDFGTDENIHPCVAAIARKFLKPGGRILPERLTTCLTPVIYGDEFRGIWRDGYHGLDLRAAVDAPYRPDAVMYGMRERPTALGPSQVVEDVVFGPDMPARSDSFPLTFTVDTDGPLQGFVGHFDAVLAGDIRLATYPCYPGCHWVNWHWPVTPPQELRAGQRIEAVLTAPALQAAACWKLDWNLA